ncbi:MAG: hypothetical protein HYV63_32215 [Candidatus Schekmanbacteria bacterium]|nr:hypothetical protein [Candidatus Schekmanbacteria bacterium]
MKDTVAEQVRAVRRKLSARFDFDVRRICDDVMQRQRAGAKEYVTQPKAEGEQSRSATDASASEQRLAVDGATHRR